jgi:Tfp pilus assembly protein PilV
MLQVLRMSVIVLGVAAFAICGLRPAEAACQLITATHSAGSKAEAAQSSRALALQSAYNLKRAKGWSYVTLSAHRVQGDPFWKAVRPKGVPADARLKPDLVTARFYTTCFTGVVVPYVCTTGSSACGQ